MTPSDSAAYLASEDMLREVLAYLQRLPVHPMTRAMAIKVQTHLDSPATGLARVAADRAEEEAAAERAAALSRHGVSGYTAAGLPVLVLSVAADRAQLHSPAALALGTSAQGRKFARQLAGELARGITIGLAPHSERPSEIKMEPPDGS